jgi:hypothetical protein
MPAEIDLLYEDLKRRAARHAITIRHAELDKELAGEFDGPTITLNNSYDPLERVFYLAHSLGSIAQWTIHCEPSRQTFRELRRVKRTSQPAAADFQRALADYLAFENRTWEYAAWLLHDTGHSKLLPPFTNFVRADMEAMRVFHTTGKAPDWQEFLTAWNEEVRLGRRKVEPFTLRPIPDFRAVAIPKQEILQEDD